MLVCNVSLLRRHAIIAAVVAETAVAIDQPGTGNVVFATLVDDPASVGDRVDAYLGEIMVEAASATATFTVSGTLNAAVVEEAAAAAVHVALLPATYSAAVAETATAADSPTASLPATYNVSVEEVAFANAAQDATGVTPSVQSAWALTASRAGLGSLIYSDDMSAKTQVAPNVGAVTSAISSDAFSGTMAESVTIGSVFAAEVAGVPADHYELDTEGDYTPWVWTVGGPTYSIAVSGTWSGSIAFDLGTEGPPGTITYYTTSGFVTANGTYHPRGEIWLRLRMTGYGSGTAVVHFTP